MAQSSLSSPRPLEAVAPGPALVEFFYHWFSELEAQGEETTFRLGSVSGSGAPVWIELPHHSFDGLGGLAHVLAQHFDAQLSLPMLPGPYPSSVRRWAAALRLLVRRAPRLLAWRYQRDQLGPDLRPASAWELLTADMTRELRERARMQRVSLNALFLHSLSHALRPLLQTGRASMEWVVPVNMRGLEPGLPRTANQAVTLDVHFPADATPGLIDRKLRAELGQNAHFGVWQLLCWLSRAGPKLVRALARRELKVRKHGSFSNLGSLHSSQLSTEPRWWLAFNPVQRTRPIGAACLTYEGRLSLTLNIHPVLGLDAAAAQRLVNDWRRRLFAGS
jgi:hypothetical protein